MELRALNDFLAIAREENITRAAEQLHVTPPTLSRQSADLEEVPGVKLCYRMTGCMCSGFLIIRHKLLSPFAHRVQ